MRPNIPAQRPDANLISNKEETPSTQGPESALRLKNERASLVLSFLFLLGGPLCLLNLWIPFSGHSIHREWTPFALAFLPASKSPIYEPQILAAIEPEQGIADRVPGSAPAPQEAQAQPAEAPLPPVVTNIGPAPKGETESSVSTPASSFDQLRFSNNPTFENWLADLREPIKGTTHADKAWLLLQASQFPDHKEQVEAVLKQEMLAKLDNSEANGTTGDPMQIALNAQDALVKLSTNAEDALAKTQSAINAHLDNPLMVDGFRNQLILRYPEMAAQLPARTAAEAGAPIQEPFPQSAPRENDGGLVIREPAQDAAILADAPPPPPIMPPPPEQSPDSF